MSSEVGVIGQRVTYSNGAVRTEEDITGPPPSLVKSSVRALKPAKGQSVIILDSPGNGVLCT